MAQTNKKKNVMQYFFSTLKFDIIRKFEFKFIYFHYRSAFVFAIFLFKNCVKHVNRDPYSCF